MQKLNKRQTLFLQTALRLKSDCAAGVWKPLPAIHALAVHYGVSYCTIWKAARALKKEGVLAVSQGARATQ